MSLTPVPGLPPGKKMDRGIGGAPAEVPSAMTLYRQDSGDVAIYAPSTGSYIVASMNATSADLTATVTALG